MAYKIIFLTFTVLLCTNASPKDMNCDKIKTAIGSISVDSAVDMARKMGYSEAQIAYARKCLAQKRK